ncbi:hypothetical protein [Micromonospora sp. KC213]|uniref:hypothetical protein n=1 Tax=Micromonospora sp. KC213 TaxID=2530378 RepID=UPI001045F4F1|nr:hypothetical protein [Micromonospora sp. KC213]TDC35706.1 hypothetical protein E1166_23200 [Micromonospora sp. KC213]
MTARFGADAPCERTACASEPAHVGGEHIDPRSPRYDGPRVTVTALPEGPRRAARALLAAGAPVAEVVDLVEEIHRLRNQVAAVQVDADRQVRAASERALSCEAHGEVIRGLEAQVTHFERQAAKNDRGRIALLGLPHALEDLKADARVTVADLKKAARKVLDAHGRAWK